MSAVKTPPNPKTAPENRQAVASDEPASADVVFRPVQIGTPHYPYGPEETRPDSERTRRPGILALLAALGVLLLIVAAAAILLERPVSKQISVPPKAAQPVDVVAAVNPTSGTVVVRSPQGNLRSISVSNPQDLLTRDGNVLAPTDVRVGDVLVVHSAVIEDKSQAWSVLKGIVARSPDPDADSLILQIGKSWHVVVSIGPSTTINGVPVSAASLMSIRDSSSVQVSGILNTRLGEMTQTESIRTLHQAA